MSFLVLDTSPTEDTGITMDSGRSDCPNSGEVKRRMDKVKIMSICLTLFPIMWIRRTQVILEFGLFYKKVGRLWNVSDL